MVYVCFGLIGLAVVLGVIAVVITVKSKGERAPEALLLFTVAQIPCFIAFALAEFFL